MNPLGVTLARVAANGFTSAGARGAVGAGGLAVFLDRARLGEGRSVDTDTAALDFTIGQSTRFGGSGRGEDWALGFQFGRR